MSETVVLEPWELPPAAEVEPYPFDLNDPQELLEAILESELGSCHRCGAELEIETRGTQTIVVTSGCSHRLPDLFARKVAEQVGRTSVTIHPRRELDTQSPPSELVPAALGMLVSLNGRDPVVFQHGDRLVSVNSGQLVPLTPPQLTVQLAAAARWRSADRYVDPPAAVVRMILSLGQYPDIPHLDRVVVTPVLSREGELVATPGYHPGSRLFYAPTPDMANLVVPEQVTRDDVDIALRLLQHDLLGDFPFVTQADRANALGAMLVPFLRDCIDGPTPMHLYDAPDAGTGKGLCASVSAMPSAGDTVASRQWSRSEEERRKAILGVLRDGAAVALFDNVEGRIDSAHLNSALTQNIYADRILRTHDSAELAVRCLWQMTANNGQPYGDFKRRVVMIRLDANCEFPRGRTGPQPGRTWNHVPLEGWAREHRAELTTACLTLCKWWVQEGMPLAPLTGFGSYEQYQQIVGGVLATAGVDGFLTNLDQLNETDERDALAALLTAWHQTFGNQSLLASELIEDGRLASFFVDLDVRPDDPIAVGTWLGLHRDRVAQGNRLERIRRGNRNAWQVVPLSPTVTP